MFRVDFISKVTYFQTRFSKSMRTSMSISNLVYVFSYFFKFSFDPFLLFNLKIFIHLLCHTAYTILHLYNTIQVIQNRVSALYSRLLVYCYICLYILKESRSEIE